MAKKGKSASPVQKVVIVGLVLIVAQLVFLFSQRGEQPPTVREAIDGVLAQQPNLDERGKAQLKISLSVNDYMAKNQGAPPASLRELTPAYFDVVPIDPSTGKEFAYRVADNRYFVGDMPLTGKTGGLIRTGSESSGGSKKEKGGGDKDSFTQDQQAALIAALDIDQTKVAMIYNPSGKRDPFLPFNFAPQTDADPNRTELEKYSLGQLRLTAVLEGFDNPAAIVENSAGKGFTVRKGTKIGSNSGEIVEIHSDRLLILETTIDFTGEKTTRTIEMKLHTGEDGGKKKKKNRQRNRG